jgi:predicted lipoprotein with Yx(FWY)xxD motif
VTDPELVWEEQSQGTRVLAVAPIVVAAVVAGCGGGSKSSSSAAPATTPSAPAATSSTPSATPAVLITTKHDKLGTILAYGSKKLTVYLFEGDKRQATSCTGTCASVWPPVTGKPTAAAGAMSPDLGTITRPDGTTQVTYKGHPLYLYSKDKDDGDTYGQGIKSFGAEWYALAPTGNKVDRS